MNQEFVMMFSGSESERLGDASADVAADGMIAALYNEVQQSLQTRTDTKMDGQMQEAVALKDCSALGSESVTPPVNVTNTSADENLQFVDENHSSDPDHSSVKVKTIEIPDSWKISILESNGASSHNVEPLAENNKQIYQLWECSRCDALFRDKESSEKHIRNCHEFSCGLCNEPFQEKEAFENHVIRHISEIPGHALQKINIGTLNTSGNEKTENLDVSKFGKASIVKSAPENLVKFDSSLTFSEECLESRECHDYDGEAAENNAKGLHFINSSNLLIKKGSDVKPHSEKQVCDVCGKVCFTKNSLLLHMTKKHSTVLSKNFICSECGKGFKWKLSLQNHQVVHHGKRKGKFP